MAKSKLERSKSDRIIAGVCGGAGRYFGIDPILLRLLFLIMFFTVGSGLLIYIILAIIIPVEKEGSEKSREENARNFVEDLSDRTQSLASKVKKNNNPETLRNFVGLGIVFLGIVLLAQEFIPFKLFYWEVFWPSVIILIGLLIIFKDKK